MKKQLLRSRKNKMIGGVAGGIAEYFEIDPVIVRAIFIISTFGWGLSIIAYIVLWIIVPEAFDEPEYIYNPETNMYDFKPPIVEELSIEKKNSRNVLVGAILILLGILFMLDNLLPNLHFAHIWPIVLIVFGGYILYKSFNSKTKEGGNEIR